MNKLIITLLYLTFIFPVAAQESDAIDFGRFYTTPRQRSQMEESRTQAPREEIEMDILVEDIPEVEQQQAVSIIDSITVNGLVYRSDGKNTAWVNSNNTIQGSIVNQYTRVQERDVKSNSVSIRLPDNRTSVELKPGQQYDINSNQIYDVVDDPITTPATNVPRDTIQRR